MKNIDKPMISIIMSVYNADKYLYDSLASIYQSSYKDFELICINDGSTDTSEEICISFKNKYKNFYHYYQENRGLAYSRNKGFAGGCNQGMKAASGNYYMLLNNDTIVTRGWLTNMVKLLESDENIGMVGPLTNSTVGKQMISVPYGEDMEAMHRFAKELAVSRQETLENIKIGCILRTNS